MSDISDDAWEAIHSPNFKGMRGDRESLGCSRKTERELLTKGLAVKVRRLWSKGYALMPTALADYMKEQKLGLPFKPTKTKAKRNDKL